MSFADGQRIADAVLWEGYLLYPYRASARKNQVRWQFGVLVPSGYADAASSSERPDAWTEVLIEPDGSAQLEVRLRFLQLQARGLEDANGTGVLSLTVDGTLHLPWDEAVERTIDVESQSVDALLEGDVRVPFEIPGGEERETLSEGAITRRRWPLTGTIVMSARREERYLRVRIAVTNDAPWENGSDRDEATRRAMLGAHLLLAVSDGRFISLLEPPAASSDAVATCEQHNLWPVLVGTDGHTMLASPIILYDQPEIAPESPGDLFDATEIDEILTLRIMTMTDEEKREARATDPRAAAIIDRSDDLPPELLDKLHGAVRMLRPMPQPAAEPTPSPFADPFSPDAPFWEPEARVDPHTATVEIGGEQVGRGALVRLVPGPRGDSMDMFLAGRIGRIEGVWETLEDESYVAIILVDDPASEEHAWVGRFLYFRPTELELAIGVTQ